MFEVDCCRICLQNKHNLTNISIPHSQVNFEKLYFCVPEIDWTCTKLPSFICPSCIINLDNAADFRKLCLYSEALRKTYIERHLTSVHTKDETAVPQSERKIEIREFNESITSCYEELDDDLLATENLPVKSMKRGALCRKLHTCIYCCKTFTSNKELRAHSKKEHNEQNAGVDKSKHKEPVCKFCQRTFTKRATLLNHIRTTHTFDKCFKCDFCEEGFTNQAALTRHRNHHTGERKYVCNFCGKSFFTNSDLNHHFQRHMNKRNYKCNICLQKSFNTASSLRTHKLVVHTNPETWKYLCTICGRKCVAQHVLTMHMKRHSDVRDFSCHLCDKKFCTRPELVKHLLSHSNLRSHKCSVCGMEYKERRIMERHLARKHGIGDRKFVERDKKHLCTICPKQFVTRTQLDKHLRAHNGERPFKCELCVQAFICKSYIKGHMKAKHSIDLDSN